MLIHLSDYASQPDIRIACTQAWTTPKWGQQPELPTSIYQADDDSLYTFDKEKVTCNACKNGNH